MNSHKHVNVVHAGICESSAPLMHHPLPQFTRNHKHQPISTQPPPPFPSPQCAEHAGTPAWLPNTPTPSHTHTSPIPAFPPLHTTLHTHGLRCTGANEHAHTCMCDGVSSLCLLFQAPRGLAAARSALLGVLPRRGRAGGPSSQQPPPQRRVRGAGLHLKVHVLQLPVLSATQNWPVAYSGRCFDPNMQSLAIGVVLLLLCTHTHTHVHRS